MIDLATCPPWVLLLVGFALGALPRDALRRLRWLSERRGGAGKG